MTSAKIPQYYHYQYKHIISSTNILFKVQIMFVLRMIFCTGINIFVLGMIFMIMMMMMMMIIILMIMITIIVIKTMIIRPKQMLIFSPNILKRDKLRQILYTYQNPLVDPATPFFFCLHDNIWSQHKDLSIL